MLKKITNTIAAAAAAITMAAVGSVAATSMTAAPAEAASVSKHVASRYKAAKKHLGKPTQAERCTLKDRGCYQRFQHGLIYRSAKSKPHAVYGPMYKKYAAQKFERGKWGYPMGEVHRSGKYLVQKFQGGVKKVYDDPGAAKRKAIVKQAREGKGVRYQSGGRSRKGWDCSGFVHYTYKKQGIKVPSTSSGLSRAGKKLSVKHAQPGDIIWKRGHVGIVTDPKKKKMVDAGNSRVNTTERSYTWMGSNAKIIRVRTLQG